MEIVAFGSECEIEGADATLLMLSRGASPISLSLGVCKV